MMSCETMYELMLRCHVPLHATMINEVIIVEGNKTQTMQLKPRIGHFYGDCFCLTFLVSKEFQLYKLQ